MFVLHSQSPLDVYPNSPDGSELCGGQSPVHNSHLHEALNRLRALGDLNNLIRDATVRLTMYGSSSFFAGCLAQTEHRPVRLVVPIVEVAHPMLPFDLKILFVRLRYSLSSQALHIFVHVHV